MVSSAFSYQNQKTYSFSLISFTSNFIAEHKERNSSSYHLIGRALIIAAGSCAMLETIGNLALSGLFLVGNALTCFQSSFFKDLLKDRISLLQSSFFLGRYCFSSLISPHLFDASVATAHPREMRIRDESCANLEARLAKEFSLCQEKRQAQFHNGGFLYLPDRKEYPIGSEEITLTGGRSAGVSHFIGRRQTMEDNHLVAEFSLAIGGRNYPVQLFGVFDGHGGPHAAEYVKTHLQKTLQEALIEFNPHSLTRQGIWNALKLTFPRLNRDFVKDCGSIAENEGTTATVAMILDGTLWTANVGDSRTVLNNNGQAVQLSDDAKPSDSRYQKGIEKRGGEVIDVDIPRVNGSLAVARAIGNHSLVGKDNNWVVSARPKITAFPMSSVEPNSHLILACDGIYDVASTKQITRGVHAQTERSPKEISADIVFSAYTSDSQDNLSALVVKL